MTKNAAINALIEKHVETLRRDSSAVIGFLDQTPPNYESAISELHKIKGSSGSIGFSKFAAASTNLHLRLKALVDDPASQQIDHSAQKLIDEFSSEKSKLSPHLSTLYK